MLYGHVHSSTLHGLLNRFYNHTTTKMSPFELVFGKEIFWKVLLLHCRGTNVKLGPQWVPGIWLTKTDGDDLHVVASPNGILRGKAIRRLMALYGQGEALQACLFSQSQPEALELWWSNYTQASLEETSYTVPEDEVEYDVDARDVPPSPVSDLDLTGFGVGKHEAAPEDFPPNKSARHGDQEEVPGAETLAGDTASAEPQQKVPRTSPQSSPTSASGSNLYPPHFAGTIQQVLAVGETDDEVWENDVADYIEPGGMV